MSGLEGAVWYDLRHTCVSRLVARGADIVRVARWIGHTKPTTTLREYGHMFPQGLDELADLLTEGRQEPLPVPEVDPDAAPHL